MIQKNDSALVEPEAQLW